MNFAAFIEAKLGIEAADQVMSAVSGLMVNLFHKTHPVKPGWQWKTPIEYLQHYQKSMQRIKEWVNRAGFEVSQRHLDGAISAMSDAMIDLYKNPDPNFTPATYVKGADPKNAETLGQFSLFLHKRVHQQPVVNPILARAAEEWRAFYQNFVDAYKRLKQ